MFFPLSFLSVEFSGIQDEVVEKLGFEKVSEEFIAECKSIAVLFRHKKTGTEIMSVLNDDENKVFGIVFRTPPWVTLHKLAHFFLLQVSSLCLVQNHICLLYYVLSGGRKWTGDEHSHYVFCFFKIIRLNIFFTTTLWWML